MLIVENKKQSYKSNVKYKKPMPDYYKTVYTISHQLTGLYSNPLSNISKYLA